MMKRLVADDDRTIPDAWRRGILKTGCTVDAMDEERTAQRIERPALEPVLPAELFCTSARTLMNGHCLLI